MQVSVICPQGYNSIRLHLFYLKRCVDDMFLKQMLVLNIIYVAVLNNK